MDGLIRRILCRGRLLFGEQGWELEVKSSRSPCMRTYDVVEVCVTTPKGLYVVDWVVIDYSDHILDRMLRGLFADVKSRQ